MPDSREEMIRRRAYELWERAGHTGYADEHWFRAEEELNSSSPSALNGASHELSPRHPGIVDPFQLGSNAAAQCADMLRPFYECLPRQRTPGKHWNLLTEIALGPDVEFKTAWQRAAARPPEAGTSGPVPGGASQSG